MTRVSTFRYKYAYITLLFLAGCFFSPARSAAQVNLALTAVASQSSGGVTVYSPANYNDNVITSWSTCVAPCPTPWGWVFDMGWIEYTWPTSQTFNKIVFYFADRPMGSCTIQYWNGSSFVNIMSYTMATCNADSVTFPAVTTTILRFFNCTAPAINPNFREIQVWQTGPTPPTVTGATSYCTGGTVSLTASSTLPSPTFSWSGPGGFTASTPTVTFTASAATAGVYSVTVTSGGSTSSATLDTIVVSAPPTITPGTVADICQGTTSASLPYSATTGSPTTYSITYSGAAIAAGFTNVTSASLPASPITLTVPAGAAAGTYSGTIAVSNASCTGSGVPFNFTINPNPVAITGATNICTGTTSTLSDATAGGTWSSSNTSIATIGSSTGIMTGVTVGSATVTYRMSATGCFTTIPVHVLGITGPDHVCAGDSVTLAVTATGGSWSSGDSTVASVNPSTGVVHGLSMGAILISYSVPTGCVATWAFTVNPLAPILGRDSACVGKMQYLTNIVGGGTWSSSIPSVATVLPDSGKVTGVAYGVTTISYVLPTGCKTSVPFTVINYPAAITGVTNVCPGATTALSDATGGGTWSSANPSVVTVNPSTGVVTGVAADTADILYTIPPGCSVQTRVLVNPLPAPITGPSIACPGTVDTMHDATMGGTWSSLTPGIATIVDTDGVVSAISGGTATFRYTLPTGCLQTKTLSVYPVPVPTVYYNSVVNTFYATPGYVTYQWYDSSQGKIPGATTSSLAATEYQWYYVEVTDSNGCKGVSAYYYFNEHIAGIKNFNASTDIRLYPNPATATLYISSPVSVRAVISSVDGKQEIVQDNAKAIDISGLAGGVYIVSLYDEDGVRITVQKLVKE